MLDSRFSIGGKKKNSFNLKKSHTNIKSTMHTAVKVSPVAIYYIVFLILPGAIKTEDKHKNNLIVQTRPKTTMSAIVKNCSYANLLHLKFKTGI